MDKWTSSNRTISGNFCAVHHRNYGTIICFLAVVGTASLPLSLTALPEPTEDIRNRALIIEYNEMYRSGDDSYLVLQTNYFHLTVFVSTALSAIFLRYLRVGV